MKKNLYLVQINRIFDNSVFFPYSIGSLSACAFEDETVRNSYNLNDFIFIYEDIEKVASRIKDPFMVGFSTYIWNTEYNLNLAKRIKEIYPECFILFGGHNVDTDSAVMLEKYSFIDFLIHDEGEYPFKELLLALENGTPLCNVPNLSYRDETGEIRSTAKKIFDIVDLPSPYTNGFFDSLIKNNNIQFQAIFETNRGCPYGCAYCDWGLFKAKLRQFPMERVLGELKWFVDNKIDYCICADGNFGILKRDTEIADYIVELKNKTGYPEVLCACFAKNSNDAVFEITSKLFKCGVIKNAMLSVQTMNETALKNIGRENLKFDKYEGISDRYKKSGMPILSELILGLPGETYESFCEGLCRLIDLGRHMTVNVYCCDILLNSRMAKKEYIDEFRIKTVRMPISQVHIEYTEDKYPEHSNIIVSTDTLSEEDWVKANMFHAVVTSFHSLGILQWFAEYLKFEKNVSYLQFYTSLFDYIMSNKGLEISKFFEKIREKYLGLLNGNGLWGFLIPNLGKIVWPVNETIFIEIIKDIDLFFNEIEPFLSSFDIEKDIYDDLVLFQKEMLKAPGLKEKSFAVKYDFYTYFKNILFENYLPLEKKNNRIDVSCPDNPEDMFEYAKYNLWFGRRKKKMLCINDLTVKYE